MIGHRLYRLTELVEPEFADGFIRKAVHEDEDIVIRWAADFHREALGEILTDHHRQLYRDRIGTGDIYLWDDKGPVSMSVRTRPTKRRISIGGVFTPPLKRNHGYATSCVAALCRELLSKYDFCLLYADLSNPVSNSIYIKMGFKEYCYLTNVYFTTETT
jgi:predicted GNAT family acetyltransferase